MGDSKNFIRKEVKGEFLETPHYLDWAATLAQSDSHQNHHLEVTFFSSLSFFHAYMHSFIHWWAMHEICGGGFTNIVFY